jgi:ribosomal protein S12 methylthiotransferase
MSQPVSYKLYMISLGCPKNLVDSEVMLGRLAAAGFRLCNEPGEAEVLLVNTCGFIQSAVEEGIDAIMEMIQLKRQAPQALLVVTGCMVQRYGEALRRELPEVDLFLGTETFSDIAVRLEHCISASKKARSPLHLGDSRFLMDSTAPRLLSTPPHRAYLKVTEGCNNRCSYCLIPSIRGRQRSRRLQDLIVEAQKLEASGVKELTLIAQDLTAYGTDFGKNGDKLTDLLDGLLKDTSIAWIRMLYLHPARLDEKIIRLTAGHSRITPYFDIPLQHVSDRILKRMRRPYTGKRAAHLLTTIRRLLPEAALRTTFMVGFPGETEKDVDQLTAFIEKHRFDHLGVFAYSDEEGSAASKLDRQVAEEVKRQRLEKVMALQAEISSQLNNAMLGRTVRVLVEGISRETDLLLEGRTGRQAAEIDGCVYINEGHCAPGDFVWVKITEAHPYDLVGEIV